MADFIGATPRNKILGALADAVQGVSDFAGKPFGYDNPPGKALSGLLGLPAVANTVNQLSYGGSLGTGSGMTWKPKEDTMDAAMIAAPMVKPMGILAKKSAEFAAPKAAQMAENYLVNTGGILPATVWHGSPHKFDKFDSSKIGTGEGAQAYGHGLYLAEAPGVAKSYADKLGERVYKGKAIKSYDYSGNVDFVDGSKAMIPDAEWSAFRAAVDKPTNPGSLYKVDLPDEQIAKMLDWDKPVGQQTPHVRDAIHRVGREPAEYGVERMADDMRMVEIQKLFNSPDGVNRLRELGIPGIRYLDGGSRGTGTGTSNYVIFPGNEDMLTILERNGQPNQFLGIK